MTAPLVKMCGFTKPEDAAAAAELGVSFVGLIFAEESGRRVSRDSAREIASAVRSVNDRASIVGVFVNETPAVVNDLVEEVGLDLVQLHGEESIETGEAISRPVIRAVRVRDSGTALVPPGSYEWLLYDAWSETSRGGSGITFDWDLLRSRPGEGRVMLSGGLSPENVAEAISIVKPDAVDVASGIESSPGVKDRARMVAFMEGAGYGQSSTR